MSSRATPTGGGHTLILQHSWAPLGSNSAMTITPEWSAAIAGYLAAQRAAGAPATTVYARRQQLENLARHLGVRDPWLVEPGELVTWVGERDWARETRRGRRTTFRSFWAWGVAHRLTSSNPAAALPGVRPAQPSPRPVPDRVFKAALARADERGKLILRLAAEAGLRRAEIAQVHSRDITEDLLGWSLVVHGKGDKPRVVPLTPRLALELRRLPEGYAFPGDDHGHLSPRWVGKIAVRLLPGDWTLHKLRHRAATHWYRESGGDVLAIQALLGHARADTTRSYVWIEDTRLRSIVDAAAS